MNGVDSGWQKRHPVEQVIDDHDRDRECQAIIGEEHRVHIMTDPERYQCTIQGHLDTQWTGWFDDLSITRTQAKDGTPITILQGSIPDQAALHGILARIRNLNLKLISIAPIDSTMPFPEDKE